jgi:mono/diheme cytochrome c family protein
MRTAAKWAVRILALVGLVAIFGAIGFASLGVSARSQPPALEVELAGAARNFLIPAAARRVPNPLAASPELLASARAHWADHCASCHGNDGKGETAIGRGLYPRSPDMTLPATQRLSDGELFWIIENGIKLTGMPAWGTSSPDDDAESWELVHLIRRFPRITAEELAEMQRLNPVSRAELERELAAERFLAGEEGADAPGAKSPPGHEDHH